MAVWVAMVGLKPSLANRAIFGDSKGLYVWVAGLAQDETRFRELIETEISGRGLSLNELADLMPADLAVEDNRHSGDPRFKDLVDSARSSPNLVFDTTYFFYEESDDDYGARGLTN